MAKKRKTPDPEPGVLIWSPIAARGNVRKWRLHACGCARLNFPKRTGKKWLAFIDLAEQYADDEITRKAFEAGRKTFRSGRKPRLTGVSGDFSLALYDSASLSQTWRDVVVAGNREYRPDSPDYERVLLRYRVLEDLIGPDPLPALDPSCRSDTVMSLAREIYQSRDYSAMPILADALQDAGCTDAVVLEHCQNPEQFHVRGCWLLDLVLGKPQGPAEPVAKKPRRTSRRKT